MPHTQRGMKITKKQLPKGYKGYVDRCNQILQVFQDHDGVITEREFNALFGTCQMVEVRDPDMAGLPIRRVKARDWGPLPMDGNDFIPPLMQGDFGVNLWLTQMMAWDMDQAVIKIERRGKKKTGMFVYSMIQPDEEDL